MNNSELVLTSLRRVIRATDLHSKRLAKTSGLTAPQILLLQTIQTKPDATIGAIAKEISLSQATVTTILDRLEKRGLIIRQRSLSDRRRVNVQLTEAGQTAIEQAPTPLQEHFTERFNALEEWEQNMIISSLQRVAIMMNAEDIEAAPLLEVGSLD